MDPIAPLLNELLSIDANNRQWAEFCHVAIVVIDEFLRPFIINSIVNGERSGPIMVHNSLQRRLMCYTLFRMEPDVFQFFCLCLRNDYDLSETDEVRHSEQVAMFMFILAHGASQHLVAAIFGLSVCTVNDHFHRVLRSVMALADIIVRPHPEYNAGAGFHMPVHPKHAPFRDCIGAIDGTHVKCVPPKNNKAAYYCRKGYTSQNVIAICDFNLCFTFASPGWEGCMHDSRVLRECREKYGGAFPHPANGKYYLVDQGYPHIEGYMAPYRGSDVRYHFQEFDNAPSRRGRKPKNPQEAFNYLHSSCRNVIERTFGVWKARFAILNSMPSYKMEKQVKIVMATMAVHNFLRINQSNDAAFNATWENNYAPSDTEENEDEVGAGPSVPRSARQSTWQLRRDEILNEIMSQV